MVRASISRNYVPTCNFNFRNKRCVNRSIRVMGEGDSTQRKAVELFGCYNLQHISGGPPQSAVNEIMSLCLLDATTLTNIHNQLSTSTTNYVALLCCNAAESECAVPLIGFPATGIIPYRCRGTWKLFRVSQLSLSER